MSVRPFFRGFLGALVLALALPPSAHAQTSPQVAAEALFREARKLVDEERYAEACEKFAASQKLEAAVGTLLNLGRCYEKIGRTASAWATYHEAIAAANGSAQLDRAETAKLRAAALEPMLSRLTIVVSPEASAQKPMIMRDREPVPSELWGVTVPVDPGEHVVQATAPSRKPWSATASVQARETATVLVPSLEADESVPLVAGGATTAAPDTASAPSADAGGWSGKKTGAVVLVGFAAAGTTLAVVEGLRYLDKKSAAENTCPAAACTDQKNLDAYLAYRDQAKQALILQWVGIGAGAAALVGATVLWLTADSSARKEGSLRVTPLVGAHELGIRGQW